MLCAGRPPLTPGIILHTLAIYCDGFYNQPPYFK